MFVSPELVGLFRTYTAAPDSVANHFNATVANATARNPLVVATGSDIAVFPGDGEPPLVEGIRTGTRGFLELAGVSHLGPAVASILRMKELDPEGFWRTGAERIVEACRAARGTNSMPLWRDQIAVAAYTGREDAIARLVDYSCRLTERYLTTALADPAYFAPETMRADYLEGPSRLDLPVPFNRVMIATFFLTGLDIAHRVIHWFDALDLPWEDAMVMMVGRAGKPTGAVTRETHSIAVIIEDASRGRLPAKNLLIAPHAPVFPSPEGGKLDEIAGLEQSYRQLWSGLAASASIAPDMFDGFPGFQPRPRGGVSIGPDTVSVDEVPFIDSPDDWFALTTRLRVVLEDPRQMASSAVADYASRQLIAQGNEPAKVIVPGLDGEPYPDLRAPAE